MKKKGISLIVLVITIVVIIILAAAVILSLGKNLSNDSWLSATKKSSSFLLTAEISSSPVTISQLTVPPRISAP